MSEGLDLVLDVGKTRVKLLLLDPQGELVDQAERRNASVDGPGYAALDTTGIGAWLSDALGTLAARWPRLSRLLVSSHGAAFAALQGEALACPVPDYEFEGFDERAPDWADQLDPFERSLSPELPRGLNAAAQFDWLERHGPAAWRAEDSVLLPYAQYWAWWACGVRASEVSSLGCHTQLWRPAENDYTALAKRRGWAARMAPLRRAWEVLGPLRPELARRLGLPQGLQVHTGVHDSNACLARYLRCWPRMTLVSTGTWIVVMAPGAPSRALDARRDLLVNVSVRQERVPTGRFMGGRELQTLCAGADPALADERSLAALLARGVLALPGFEPQGGPFREQAGRLVDAQGQVLPLESFSPAERATLAALYSAQMTAWLVDHLAGAQPVVVEGPFAANAVYTGVLAALLPPGALQISGDALEGTARGAWELSHWTEARVSEPRVQPAQACALPGLTALHERWKQALAA